MKTDALVLGSTMSSGPGAMQSRTWPPEAQGSATACQGHPDAPSRRSPLHSSQCSRSARRACRQSGHVGCPPILHAQAAFSQA